MSTHIVYIPRYKHVETSNRNFERRKNLLRLLDKAASGPTPVSTEKPKPQCVDEKKDVNVVVNININYNCKCDCDCNHDTRRCKQSTKVPYIKTKPTPNKPKYSPVSVDKLKVKRINDDKPEVKMPTHLYRDSYTTPIHSDIGLKYDPSDLCTISQVSSKDNTDNVITTAHWGHGTTSTTNNKNDNTITRNGAYKNSASTKSI